MTELFKRATWAQYINDSSGQYNDCKVLYITDKNIHRVCYNNDSKVSYIMYSESYGRCDFSYSQVSDIQDELSPGIYIFNDNVIYYYTGTNWIKLGAAGEGGGSFDNSCTIWSQHIEYGAGGYDKVSDIGNLQIQGFVEGQIDGGAW